MSAFITDHDTTISHMVEHAKRLYDRFGPGLQSDPEISALVTAYAGAIARSGARMLDMGVVETCTDCATKGPGSCCFPGIESGYDPVLLLINRLMGCPLPDAREVETSCFFVGPTGCKLKGRYYFCLQYLCPRLEKLLGPLRAHDLLSNIGEELAAGWRLEQAVRRRLGPQCEDGP
ncbi:MAG: hypothetical protein AB9873_20620 [Syntrophobacteraceae bacterium]